MGVEYQRIANAIAQLAEDTRRPPLILSLCEWGQVSSVLLLLLHYVHLRHSGATLAMGPAVRTELAGKCSFYIFRSA